MSPSPLSKSRAVTAPTWRMPSPNSSRAAAGALLATRDADSVGTTFDDRLGLLDTARRIFAVGLALPFRVGFEIGVYLGSRFGKPPYVAEPLEQVARGHRADMADAEPEQQPRGVGRALRLDRGEEIIDRLFLPALAPEQLGAVRLQPEDVGGTDRKSTSLNSSPYCATCLTSTDGNKKKTINNS